MLKAVFKSWFSWDFTIYDEMTPMAQIEMAWAREVAEMKFGNATYTMSREGRFSGAFLLKSGARVVARAEKPSALQRSFKIEYQNKQFTLVAAAAFSRKFFLREGERIAGSVQPERVFTRSAVIDLPPTIELPVKVFLTWLALILWRRAARAAAS